MPRMAENVMAAQNARTAGWTARFAEAAPGAILGAALGAVLVAIFGFLGWIAISVVDLQTRVGKLEDGLQQVNERLTAVDARLTRLETRVDDIYKLLAERLPPPPEKEQP